MGTIELHFGLGSLLIPERIFPSALALALHECMHITQEYPMYSVCILQSLSVCAE